MSMNVGMILSPATTAAAQPAAIPFVINPDVLKKSEADAIKDYRAVNVVPSVVHVEGATPVGVVLLQDPVAGTFVARGSRPKIFVGVDAPVQPASITAALDAIKTDLGVVKADVGKVNTAVATVAKDVKADVAAVQTDVDKIQTAVKTVKSDVDKVETAVKGVGTKLTSVVQDVKTIKTAVTRKSGASAGPP